MFKQITKRDGRVVDFEIGKIASAINKAFVACNRSEDASVFDKIANDVVSAIEITHGETYTPSVEEIQDTVERMLGKCGYLDVAKAYILYRADRTRARDSETRLMKEFADIVTVDSKQSDNKRENANIDGDSPMGTMLKLGSEASKRFYLEHMLSPAVAKAHIDGDIHIHDLDFYALTMTCCQIDLGKLFKGGFGTGHGALREPGGIRAAGALTAVAIQADQNDQHGGQSIPALDFYLAPYVAKTYAKQFKTNLARVLDLYGDVEDGENEKMANSILETVKNETGLSPTLKENYKFEDALQKELYGSFDAEQAMKIRERTKKYAYRETVKETYQAMEALIHNLNTLHSRAGAQVPFSSLNYGTDTSEEGRMVMKQLLLATEAGLGNGETPIFPIQIFKLKKGINYDPGDPNYDLFKLAMRVSAKRMFPNFSNLDAPYNLQYYKEGDPRTEVAYMGCRTRVMGNVYDPTQEIATGRGNLSFTSINLPRLGLLANRNLDEFFKLLENRMDLVTDQLLERFEVVAKRKVFNFPFNMGEGVWLDSDTLDKDDEVREVMKHGSLTYGFIGLAECLVALIGKHHGMDEEAQKLGLKIVRFMRDYSDRKARETGLNFALIATPAEGLSGRFVRIDKQKFGIIPGITDRDYYTNSFHVPVYYPISAFDKIHIEAPYHALTNGGHISYVEMDGDVTRNLEAMERIIREMHDCGIGYGAINHPIDRDPVCGYNGIIGDFCPKCGRRECDGVHFERIRRITGYLVGTLDRFNNSKRAEEHDRVKHA